VSQSRDTFGVLIASGSGSELFPPLLHVASGAALLHSRFSLFADNLFPISGSNWSIEDAIETGMPLYYNCSDDASGEQPCTQYMLMPDRLASVGATSAWHACTHASLTPGVLTQPTRMHCRLRSQTCQFMAHY
jgi:hypothetical protein